MPFLHKTVSGATQSISLKATDLVALLTPCPARVEVKGGPLFISFDANRDPATMPRRPPALKDDDIPWGYGGDRLFDDEFFAANPDRRVRRVTATRGDRYRAGLPDDLPAGKFAIRLSRLHDRTGDTFRTSELVVAVPRAVLDSVNAASDTELLVWWYLLEVVKALSPKPDIEEVQFT